MRKTATEVMEGILFSAVVDAIMALKDASKGMPNTLLRDMAAVHPNVTLADLPKELQAAIGASVRGAFVRLQKDGYTVTGGDAAPTRPAPRPSRPQPSGPPRRPPQGGPRPPRGPGGPRR